MARSIQNVAIVGDLVYAPSDDGVLHAVSRPDGIERWTYPAAGSDVSVAEGSLADRRRLRARSMALDALYGRRALGRRPASHPNGRDVWRRSLLRRDRGRRARRPRPCDGRRSAGDSKISDSQVHNPSFRDGRVFVGSLGAYVAVDARRRPPPVDGRPRALMTRAPPESRMASPSSAKSGDATSSHLRAIDAESGTEAVERRGTLRRADHRRGSSATPAARAD